MTPTPEQQAAYISHLECDLGSRLREIEQLNLANLKLRKELDVASFNWRAASVNKGPVTLKSQMHKRYFAAGALVASLVWIVASVAMQMMGY